MTAPFHNHVLRDYQPNTCDACAATTAPTPAPTERIYAERALAATAEPTLAQLLDFEAGHPRNTGAKELRIRDELGLRPARYYQLLHRAIATEAALQHDPITTHRLRRVTAAAAAETARRLG